MIKLNKNLILASQSPRRQELLKGLGLTFSVKRIAVDESFSDDLPKEKVAIYLAEKKAKASIDTLLEDDLLITADTVVITENRILNKPESITEAADMLRKLSGSQHQVITGVCIMDKENIYAFDDQTTVYFDRLEEKEIFYYLNEFQPLDKAGAYGIQEWLGFSIIKKIEGSFYNVMGLPVQKVYSLLKAKYRLDFGN